jgi:adenine-specific DNA-methyltransferase
MALKQVQQMQELLKKSEKFIDKEQNLYIPKILEAIDQIDGELIKLLISDEKIKNNFFTKVEDIYVLNQNKLIEFFTMNEHMKNSYTSYTNKIGLVKKDNFIKKFDDVVLAWPHKDCTLEGGQSKDDEKNSEVFYNEILSRDEIDRLFEPKALTNIKRYTKSGVEENPQITKDDNIIIKGNNLIALHSLKKKYAGKVKLIYIDPPYNTGNDSFKYNDNFNHSTWLTFMKNRLEVAKEFLSDDGVIFVQIGHQESAYLKVLMDEIFLQDKFVNEICWKKYGGVKNQASKKLTTQHETIYIYKIGDEFKINMQYNPLSEKYVKDEYKYKDENGRIYAKLRGRSYQNKDGQATIKYLDEVKGSPITTLWSEAHLQLNTSDKEKMNNGFEGQKPETLIERIISLSTKQNNLIMDFHLGSGTTCAVAHKMGRRYIGIEQMDYIEDISVERLKKVIDGEQDGISKAVDWQGGGSFVYAELKQIDSFKDAEVGKLNKNMQYLPVSEIEDEDYGVSKEEIAVNKKFYGLDDE